MNIALIKAGGMGNRMKAGIPKQFIEVFGKPIIIYTLEAFERHPMIDAIVVVCVAGWHEILKSYASKYHINKLVKVVNGGETSLKSIYAGLKKIDEMYEKNDIVLIHDGNRPLVSQEIISDVLVQTQLHGAAVAAMLCTDEVMETEGQLKEAEKYLDHKKLYRIQTPDAYRLGDVMDLYKNATEKQLTQLGATNVLMVDMGHKVYFAEGSEINIRLTTQEDIIIFEALFTTLTMSKEIEGE
ncbi:MAG: 2-C-methyl-D-erythritol 4-phosphate cytidylyltransferase [Parabacteroides sp.]|nr:2-C-methyl-D-erythritol 4-phosphate cytidylyltransferase [Parabacteroides sp.]